MKGRKILVFFFLLLCITGGMGLGLSIALMRDLPQIAALEGYKPALISTLLFEDGEILAKFYSENRIPVSTSEIPDKLKKALLATEDREFYQHNGIVLKGIIRATLKNIGSGGYKEGASTLTQQLAKTLFLTPEKSLIRKVREAILALQIERRYTKDEILTLYLNQIYLGSGAYGVEAASLRYFGKSVKDLSLAEAALIAGLPKSPTNYSPRVNEERALFRRNTVLRQMFSTGVITAEELDEALKTPLILSENTARQRRAPWFVEQVRLELEEVLGPDALYFSGLTVYTSLRSDLQSHAEEAAATHLKGLENRMRAKGIEALPEVAILALDVRDGAILAHVGGRDFIKSPYDRAFQARRQVGSAFKPFVYALAVEEGMEQDKMISDTPVVYPISKGNVWEPRNYSRDFLGDISLRKALALSRNIPAIRLLDQMRPERVIAFAEKLGVESPMQPHLSLALGTADMNLAELTRAFGVFPSGGILSDPWRIRKVVDANGQILYSSPRGSKAVLDKRAAAIMTDMLEAVIREGSGRSAFTPSRAFAGKTGTTANFKDALFVGFSPEIVLGVWTGCDDNTSLGDGENGTRAALPFWRDIMRKTRPSETPEYFPIPAGTERKPMADGTMALFRKN